MSGMNCTNSGNYYYSVGTGDVITITVPLSPETRYFGVAAAWRAFNTAGIRYVPNERPAVNPWRHAYTRLKHFEHAAAAMETRQKGITEDERALMLTADGYWTPSWRFWWAEVEYCCAADNCHWVTT